MRRNASTSASVDTASASRSRMCIPFDFGADISMDADNRDPRASAETRSKASVAVQSGSATSSAYSSLLAVTSPNEGPPMPWPATSCRRKILSSQRVKHCGLKMSPWTTPRLMGNGSEHTVSRLGSRRRTMPVAPSYIALMIRRTLGVTLAADRYSSRKRWLIVSKAAR